MALKKKPKVHKMPPKIPVKPPIIKDAEIAYYYTKSAKNEQKTPLNSVKMLFNCNISNRLKSANYALSPCRFGLEWWRFHVLLVLPPTHCT